MNAEKIKEIRLGQIRWPNEIMWIDEQQAKQGWLAVVSNHELQALLDEVEALTKVLEAARRVYVDRHADGGESVTTLFAAIAAVELTARHEPKDAER